MKNKTKRISYGSLFVTLSFFYLPLLIFSSSKVHEDFVYNPERDTKIPLELNPNLGHKTSSGENDGYCHKNQTSSERIERETLSNAKTKHQHAVPNGDNHGENTRGLGRHHEHESEDDHEIHEGHGHDSHAGHSDKVKLTEDALKLFKIRIEPVRRNQLVPKIISPARVTFNIDNVAHVGSSVSGRVKEIQFGLGDRVLKGDVLLTVDSPELGRLQSDFLHRILSKFDLILYSEISFYRS